MKIKFFVLFAVAIPAYAQLNVSGFVGINPNNTNFLDLYWKPGIICGAGSEVFVSPSIALSPSVEYAHYTFDNYEVYHEVSVPEVHIISVIGEPLNLWRLFLEAKFFGNLTTTIPVYFTTGFGYVNRDVGVIHRTFKDMNYPNTFTGTIKFENSSVIVHTMGLGIRLRVTPYFSLDLKGQYFTNYNDRWYTSLKCGIVYTVFK